MGRKRVEKKKGFSRASAEIKSGKPAMVMLPSSYSLPELLQYWAVHLEQRGSLYNPGATAARTWVKMCSVLVTNKHLNSCGYCDQTQATASIFVSVHMDSYCL